MSWIVSQEETAKGGACQPATMRKEEKYKMIHAHESGRLIPKEDKIFALNGRAKAMAEELGRDAVINASIGALLDDCGDLIVMSSVYRQIQKLSAGDFAEYAPIGGTQGFKMAIIDAVMEGYHTNRHVRVVASPGGTGAIHLAVHNYTEVGDTVLTSDWYWAPYEKICNDSGRNLATYEMFDAEGNFKLDALQAKANELIEEQGSLLLLLNTPAHNPTGYSLKEEEWERLVDILNKASEKGRVSLFIDVAYIDFAGDVENTRCFLPILEKCNDRVLPLIGYSASKTFTIYGMRCGAIMCLAPSMEIADEFASVCEYSARASWSNAARSAQVLIENIYSDEDIRADVDCERDEFREMLQARGNRFAATLEDQGVDHVPFDAGFFACVATDRAQEISQELEKRGMFVVPLKKGIRISLASVSEDKCVKLAKAIADIMK